MKIKTATTIFEVLASEVRLSIFRLLVKYAPEGLVAGEISQMLDIPKTNLSFHLKNIMYSGLVSMEREGRNTRYRANIPSRVRMLFRQFCPLPAVLGGRRYRTGIFIGLLPKTNV